MMLASIALICPSVLGLKFLEHLMKDLSLKNTIYYFLIMLLFSTFFGSFIANLFFDVKAYLFANLNQFPIFFCKYTLISILINLILAIIFSMILKNFDFSLEVKSDIQRKKKKNNL